jgi:hypothetical protein
VVTVLDELERVARLVARLIPTLPPTRTHQRIALTRAILTGDPDAAGTAMHTRGVTARSEIIDVLLSSPALTTTSISLPEQEERSPGPPASHA